MNKIKIVTNKQRTKINFNKKYNNAKTNIKINFKTKKNNRNVYFLSLGHKIASITDLGITRILHFIPIL